MPERTVKDDFAMLGWAVGPANTALKDWAVHALKTARTVVTDPAMAHWHQCEGTWFVGVDALPNAADGRVGASAPLRRADLHPLGHITGPLPALHNAQLSVTYPGYPRPREGESDAAFRYRRNRDAAHVDGVLATGSARRRRVQEPHAFILGLPLTRADPEASPLVVWEGSHHIMRAAFTQVFEGYARDTWSEVDVTEAYQAARREVFETCRRVPVLAAPGSALVLHRLALHGVAPWEDGAKADPDGRMIAYFRPPMPGGVSAWLDLP